MSHLKKFPSQELIKEAALETNLSPAYIEKDWFSVQLVKLANEYFKDDQQIIFTGGTCLSKCYGLIERFSEDLDFLLRGRESTQSTQSNRRRTRKLFTEALSKDQDFEINPDKVEKANNNNFFRIPVAYNNIFKESHLRNFLQIEITFSIPRLNTIRKPISSIISALKNEGPEIEINCISPVEIAADKLSALIWRTIDRDRASLKDDPRILRHLYDLTALRKVIGESKDDFKKIATTSLEKDLRVRSQKGKTYNSISESLEAGLSQLLTDPKNEKEYESFVLAMSYAKDPYKYTFKAVTDALKEIVDIYLH